MKRKHDDTPTSRSLRRVNFFWFPRLFPELQAEVVSYVTEVADRAALARTCKSMHKRMAPRLPHIPGKWADIWAHTKKRCWPRLVVRDALIELMEFGVTPGSAIGVEHDTFKIIWWDKAYWRLTFNVRSFAWPWSLDRGIDRLGSIVSSLSELDPAFVAEWRQAM